MIDAAVEQLLRQDPKSYVIPAEVVANVTATNTLEHALMVLSKVGYTRIPVLAPDDHLQGLLALSDVTDNLLRVPGAAVENLNQVLVSDVMRPVTHWVDDPTKLEKILNLLVDEPFLPLVDDQMIFQGIITRREILKRVNYLAHNLNRQYTVTPKMIDTPAN
ncbi:cyclic-di-AMP-binding protein CbpB [Levilactobacillus namurensis]|uniref:cyclic-di-AMP-binding protein CbpB n=1 Tax=Levilactobacillus namurensis TaxID=380393 RepID=UPI0022309E2B|nr:cyclic-di-AMP-binding protein CbpB [Levilactobacillus namurensis]MCW3778937.1 CBS domain-containing protein [Levilactobacillus namurensis]MDT7018918.1 cyclic-di-AMP-binding protein CbpB [Levilactobacillus namurensis]WNN66467.1 cyclic-di-AMP-binding protein CbpB [Levilactobacillus namurensis]